MTVTAAARRISAVTSTVAVPFMFLFSGSIVAFRCYINFEWAKSIPFGTIKPDSVLSCINCRMLGNERETTKTVGV